MFKFPTIRVPSVRALLAVGGAAAVVAGAVAGTDTLAASTDSVTADVSQIASENFFPTPLPAGNPSCKESGSLGFHKATVSWPSAGPGYGYRLTLWNESRTSVEWSAWYQTGTYWEFSINYNLSWANYTVTIQTVNLASGASDAERLYSSGFFVHKVGSNAQRNATCQGGAGKVTNASWEDSTEWTPSAPMLRGGRAQVGKTLPLEKAEPSTPSTTSPSPKPSETPEPSTPSTSATPSAPSTSAEPSTPSTTPAEEPKVTFGIGVAGREKVLLLYRDSDETCHTPLVEGDEPSINGNTVVIQRGNTVKQVDPLTCALS